MEFGNRQKTLPEYPRHRYGDQTRLRMGLGFSQQKYMNMTDNHVVKRKQIEDIKSWIKADDYSQPARRFVVHGESKNGKTVAAHQLVTWGRENGYFVIFTNNLHHFMQRLHNKEVIINRKDITTRAFKTKKQMKGMTHYDASLVTHMYS